MRSNTLNSIMFAGMVLLSASCGRGEWPADNDVRISWDRSTFTEMKSVNVQNAGFEEVK